MFEVVTVVGAFVADAQDILSIAVFLFVFVPSYQDDFPLIWYSGRSSQSPRMSYRLLLAIGKAEELHVVWWVCLCMCKWCACHDGVDGGRRGDGVCWWYDGVDGRCLCEWCACCGVDGKRRGDGVCL